jgi:hypothetical protein
MMAACAPVHLACAPNRIYEGIYTWGAEVETFSPCGTGGKEWWVSTTEPIWEQLRNDTMRLTTEPYEGIYVKVTGNYAGPATEETGGAFSTQYEGLFKVTKVWLTRKTADADCKGVNSSN